MFAPENHDLLSPSLVISLEIRLLQWNNAVEQINFGNIILISDVGFMINRIE